MVPTTFNACGSITVTELSSSVVKHPLLTQAQQVAGDMSQSRWLLMEEAQNELPLPLLIMICWLTVLFVSFGLFSPRNATVIFVRFVCACSDVSSLRASDMEPSRLA
jgi:hypothetical protein